MPTTRYVPDTFEQECICLLYKWLSQNGFQNPDLPPIYCSFETPPQFERVVQDWHEIFSDDIWGALTSDNNSAIELLNDNQKNLVKELNDGEVPWSAEKRKSLVGRLVSIDTVLGTYHSDTPHIVLYMQGIYASAKRHNVPMEMLRAVVLVHEIGHWISYAVQQFTNIQSNENLQYYLLSDISKESEKAKEMWAQLFPYWVAKELRGSFKLTFNTLNTNQRDVYHTYKEFVKESIPTMLNVLKEYHRELDPGQELPECKRYEEISRENDFSGKRLSRKLKIQKGTIGDIAGIF
jgi:hypothetical protein